MTEAQVDNLSHERAERYLVPLRTESGGVLRKEMGGHTP